ncbi:MAG: tetratricopeptide repeat protein [Acidithiobacillus sp.]|nr:tetratricopeptide repeat protein [Acidithiobacillus sp.]
MSRKMLVAILASVSIGLAAPMVWAEPSVPQVIHSIQSGHYSQAEQQLSEVLASHPNSAQAYYLQSQLYAKEGKWDAAAASLQRAKNIDPAMTFVQPRQLAQLEKQLQRHVSKPSLASKPAAPEHSALGKALALFLGLIAIIFGISWFLRRRRQQQWIAQQPMQGFGNPGFPGQNPNGFGGQPYGGPMGGAPGAGGLGSGLASGIATGVGIGAGMAAGSALANGLFGGHEGQSQQVDNLGMTDASWGDSTDQPSNDDFGMGGDDSWV